MIVMPNRGWVSFHRKTVDAPFYKDSEAVHLWFHLVLSANHKDNKTMVGQTIVAIPRGSLLTGRKSLSSATGIHESKIQRLLKLFEKNEQIEQQTFTKYRLISITNYNEYQDSEQQVNSSRTATEQQLNTNNNDNNANHVNKDLLPENLKVSMPLDFSLNDTNRNWVNDSELSNTDKHELLKDFIDYWTLDESKKTEKGWQMSFRKNPIVKRKIVNSKHRGQSNGYEQKDTRSRAKKVSDKLDEIARRDIEENGFAQTLD